MPAPKELSDNKGAIAVAVIAALGAIIVAYVNLAGDGKKTSSPTTPTSNDGTAVVSSPDSTTTTGSAVTAGPYSPSYVTGDGVTIIVGAPPTSIDPPRPPEIIVDVHVIVRTGRGDKECGVFAVELFQGSQRILRKEYGDDQDWNEGHVLDQTHTDLNTSLTGEPLHAVTALEERPGQKNIVWDANIELEVVTNRNRRLRFEGSRRFDTDHNKPKHVFDMGTRQF